MLESLNKQFDKLNKLAAVLTTIGVIGGAWYYYRTVLWMPVLNVVSVDWDKGIAQVRVGTTKVYTLYKNQTLAIGGDFGIRFSGDTDDSISRIELYKNFLTYKVIAKK